MTMILPKPDSRRRVAIFHFESEESDPTTDWLSYGIPVAMQAKLSFDPWFLLGMGFPDDL